MDNSTRAPVLRFGPDRRLTALCAGLAVVAIAFVVLSDDGAGRVLAGLGAVLLAGYAVTDLAFWPRLTVTGDGVRIRTPTTRAVLPWADVDAVRVDEHSHLGLTSRTLEIDAGALLVVFSRRTLGADPREVADLLAAFSR
ncbi:MAG TPA: PH domain-containing protein [Jatrophihabitantaceae bacterium]